MYRTRSQTCDAVKPLALTPSTTSTGGHRSSGDSLADASKQGLAVTAAVKDTVLQVAWQDLSGAQRAGFAKRTHRLAITWRQTKSSRILFGPIVVIERGNLGVAPRSMTANTIDDGSVEQILAAADRLFKFLALQRRGRRNVDDLAGRCQPTLDDTRRGPHR